MPNIDLLSIDPDQLFEEHTITEITEIHKKIQAELDKKRQELRFMVGERYRDVITAADTIKYMQKYSEQLVEKIESINKKCHSIHSAIDVEMAKPTIVDKSNIFYRSVAIQIKILILIPEYIWSCLDISDYLKASQLYLLAIHMHTGLELDTEHQITEHFALLSRLRLSINLFRNRIIEGLKKRLQSIRITPEEASNHLSAYMLLENQSLKDVLLTLVELREKSLAELLKADISQKNTVRSQTMSLMACLICTIQLIHSSFVGYAKSDGLIATQLGKICLKNSESTISLIDLEPTPLLEYLPAIVNDFRPTCDDYNNPTIKDVVKDIVDQWLKNTARTLQINLSKSLDLVTSVKYLHSIREESLKLVLPEDWDDICTNLNLPNNFNVWYFLFQPLVSTRAEQLVCRKIEINLEHLYDKINKDLTAAHTSEQSERDLRWYVWSESINDLSKDSNYHAGLSMKAKGYSHRIVSLCEDLNNKSLELSQDVSLYLYGTEKVDTENTATLKKEQIEEIKRLELHLSKESSNSVDQIISYIENLLSKETDDEIKLTKTIASMRFLQAIPELCPHLMDCCSRGGAQQTWTDVSNKLTEHCLRLWQRWLTAVLGRIEQLMEIHVIDGDLLNLLDTMPRWDVIDIEEQDEDKTVNSQIRIPLLPTITLMALLSDINEELNAILPATVPKQIHVQFIESVTDLILGRYESIPKAEINQTQALQFLMDVKYITTLCIRRENKSLLSKSQQICDDLRSRVDPFDLDVFYPHLQTNIKRAVLQTQALYGCFLPSPDQLSSLGMLETNPADKDPSVLAVSSLSNDTWFPLLPVTTPTIKPMNLRPVTPATTTAVPSTVTKNTSTKPSPETSSATSMRSGAAAFFGAMTTDWFS